MPDFDQLQVGNAVLPLTTTSERGLLFDADPALAYALDFWVYVIRTYVGTRLVQELAEAGITWAGRPISDAVAQWYPYEPLPEQLENQFQFPLLAAYRTEISTERFTAGHDVDSTALEVLYILPPLDAAGMERVAPILHAIMQSLRRKTTDAWDPGYTPPGGNPGDQFTSKPYANVDAIGFGDDRDYQHGRRNPMGSHGWLSSGGGLHFPTLRLKAYVRERDEYNPTQGGPRKFAGADITADLLAPDGSRVHPLVQVATQQAPTVTSLSPSAGTAAGGTSVTITGTLFLSGPPQVQFGGNYAPSVTFNSSTSLTVTTPAMSGPGAVGVTITNRDGQSVLALSAFTFTSP